MFKWLLIISFFINVSAKAQMKVAFIRVFDKNSRPIKLETNADYFHIAISYKDGWVHAHNFRGVEKIKHFREMGFPNFTVTILNHKYHPNLDHEIGQYVGKKFDHGFSWGGESLYCSELVARVFNLEPAPMSFDGEQWDKLRSSKGELGISPDEVYHALSAQGFEIDRNCSTFL